MNTFHNNADDAALSMLLHSMPSCGSPLGTMNLPPPSGVALSSTVLFSSVPSTTASECLCYVSRTRASTSWIASSTTCGSSHCTKCPLFWAINNLSSLWRQPPLVVWAPKLLTCVNRLGCFWPAERPPPREYPETKGPNNEFAGRFLPTRKVPCVGGVHFQPRRRANRTTGAPNDTFLMTGGGGSLLHGPFLFRMRRVEEDHAGDLVGKNSLAYSCAYIPPIECSPMEQLTVGWFVLVVAKDRGAKQQSLVPSAEHPPR